MTSALLALLVILSPDVAAAQTAGKPAPSAQPPEMTKLWIVAGGGSSTFLADCYDFTTPGSTEPVKCPEPEHYEHSGGLLLSAGRSVTRKLDFGAELFWSTSGTTGGGDRARTTFALVTTQFRPWQSQGFFVKAGIGIGFIRNNVTINDQSGEFLTKAMSVAIGGGWEWRFTRRFGAEVYATQYAAAAGDILVSAGTAQNVMVNYWSVGGAVVIR
jgi:hypothetical protein